MTKITTDMIMGDIIRQYPQVVDTLVAQGMHCLGCPSSQQESLANACFVHGLDPEAVAVLLTLLWKLNNRRDGR